MFRHFLFLAVLVVSTTESLAITHNLFEIENVEMSDGVKLLTYVFLPDDQKKTSPVILSRTPYLYVNGRLHPATIDTAVNFANRGYVYVLQAIRGAEGSEGVYKIFNSQEIGDARTTLNWVASQPFSNGKIAAMGTSYDGFTALAAAVTNHPNLKVVFSGGAPTRLRTDAFIRGGMIPLGLLDYLRFKSLGGTIYAGLFNENMSSLLINEPDPTKYDNLLLHENIDEWDNIVKSLYTNDLDFFEERSIKDQLHKISLPTYHIAGTRLDGDNLDVISNFKQIIQQSSDISNHHLIVGPWEHGGSTPYFIGEQGYASPLVEERVFPLLAHYLKGLPFPFKSDPLVMWQDEDLKVYEDSSFPLSFSKRKRLYFSGSGLLSLNSFNSSSNDYTSIPYFFNQSFDSTRIQYATYGFPIEEPLKMMGEFGGEFHISSDMSSFQVFVSLSAVSKDGGAKFISNCPLGGMVQKLNSAKVMYEVNSSDCPVNANLEKGDTLIVTVASNVYSGYLRPREYNPISETWQFTNNGVVKLHHSSEFSSYIFFDSID